MLNGKPSDTSISPLAEGELIAGVVEASSSKLKIWPCEYERSRCRKTLSDIEYCKSAGLQASLVLLLKADPSRTHGLSGSGSCSEKRSSSTSPPKVLILASKNATPSASIASTIMFDALLKAT